MRGGLLRAGRPCFFCSPSSLQSGAYSCILSWFLVFVVGLSSGILCIPAAILGFFGLFILFVDSVSYGVGLLVIAFLISPYGLPMLAGWLVAKLHVLRYMLRDWIYG